MNYNPYYFAPYISQAPIRSGIFNNIFGGIKTINWSGILGGTQKALNIANQAIPVIKQVSPMMKNAKTMFKVMNEFKKVETPEVVTINNDSSSYNNDNNLNISESKTLENINGPTFFI